MNDFYAYWNAAQIRDLFEAIVFIVGGGDFLGLLRSIAVAGALIVSTGAIMSRRHEDHFLYLGGLAIFYMILLVPKQDVVIRDVRAGSVYVVQNVPLGIGFFASTASHIGYWLTDLFETAFIPANDTGKFSRFGLSFPQRALTAMQNIGATTPQGRELINAFVKDCVIPEMVETPAKANEVIRSPDIWTTITAAGWINPARMSVLANGTVQQCDAVPSTVFIQLGNEYTALREKLGHQLLGDRPNPSVSIAAAMPQVESLLMTMARSFDESMRQSIMMQAIPEGATLAGASAEPLALAVGMATGQANVSSVINYRTMAALAKNFLPNIRNAIEFMVIAAFPLMMLMVLAAGHRAGLVLKGFFVMLIWVQLWAPLYAVINYLLVVTDANPLTQIFASFGGNSLASVNLIREIGATSQDIAGMLTISVPIIAYALAKSSEIATTSMISTVLAPAQGAAQQMGSQLSQGNVALGNMSWGNYSANNVSANKSDSSIGWADPAMVSKRSGYGSTTYQDGRLAAAESSTISLGAVASSQRGQTLSNANFSGDTVKGAWATSAGLDLQAAASSSDSNTARAARLISAGISNQLSADNSGRYVDSTMAGRNSSEGSEVNSTARNWELGTVVSQIGATGAMVPGSSGSGGRSGDAGTGAARAGFGANVSTSQQLVDTATNKAGTASQFDQKKAAERIQNAVNAIQSSNEDRGVKEAALGFMAELNRRTASTYGNTASVGGEKSAGDESRRSTTGGGSGGVDLGPKLSSALAGTYGSPEAAQRARIEDPTGFHQHAIAALDSVLGKSQRTAEGGLASPQPTSSVLAHGGAAVAALHGRANGAVAASNVSNEERAAARQVASPTSSPDQTPATRAHELASSKVDGTIGQQQEWQNTVGGAATAGDALYRANQTGLQTLAGNAFLFGMGYRNGAQISQDLQAIAARDPAVKEMLAHINKGGIDQESDGGRRQLEYLNQQLRARDIQPAAAPLGGNLSDGG